MQQIPELLFLALDYYRYPSDYDEQRSAAPLPPGVTALLASQDGCLSEEQIAETATALAVSEADCRAAVLRYIQLLMFDSPKDHYRVLGLTRRADQKQIVQHHDYISRLLAAQWDADDPHWGTRHTPRVEQAFAVLNDTGRRAEYDVEQAGGGIVIMMGKARQAPEPVPVNPIPQQLEALASSGAMDHSLAQAETAEESPAQEQPADPVHAGAASDAATSTPVAAHAKPPASIFSSPWLYVAIVLVCVMGVGVYTFNQASRGPEIALPKLPAPAVAAGVKPQENADPLQAANAQTEADVTEQDAVAETAPEAEPAPDSIASAASSPLLQAGASTVEPITDAELDSLLQLFGEHYQAKDAAAFAGLFAADAYTSRAEGRAGIDDYFARIFSNIRVLSVGFSDVVWQAGTSPREGSARVAITALPAQRGRGATLEAEVDFEVGRNADGALEITRMTF